LAYAQILERKHLFSSPNKRVVGCVGSRPQDSSPPTIHGFDDLLFKNDYITPRGLFVTNKGLTIQMLNGFMAPVYQSGSGPINDVSLVAGIWNDFNPARL
jgi:hypothetical protein